MNEEKDFKVVDRRSASRTEETAPKPTENNPKSGDGFVMKEASEEAASATGDAGAPPQIDFSTLVFSLATGALINLGLTPDPATQQMNKNLDIAKQNIDILEILRAKTKGNLTKEEDQMLESILTEVRLKFVEVSTKK